MRKEKSMNNIDFEKDQREDLDSINEAKSLSDQVVKLRNLEDDLVLKEKEFKELKRKVELVSGDVIPTMMQEMNISTLKLADGSSVEVNRFTVLQSLPQRKRKHSNGFEITAWEILLKMRSLLPLVVTKITRHRNMRSLRKVKGTNPSRN